MPGRDTDSLPAPGAGMSAGAARRSACATSSPRNVCGSGGLSLNDALHVAGQLGRAPPFACAVIRRAGDARHYKEESVAEAAAVVLLPRRSKQWQVAFGIPADVQIVIGIHRQATPHDGRVDTRS